MNADEYECDSLVRLAVLQVVAGHNPPILPPPLCLGVKLVWLPQISAAMHD